MDMHRKIISFAMSLAMKELKDNRLLLLTSHGLLSALPVFSDDQYPQAKVLYQFLESSEKACNKNFMPNPDRHMIFDKDSILLKEIQLITPNGTHNLGSFLLNTSLVTAVSIGDFKQSN